MTAREITPVEQWSGLHVIDIETSGGTFAEFKAILDAHADEVFRARMAAEQMRSTPPIVVSVEAEAHGGEP